MSSSETGFVVWVPYNIYIYRIVIYFLLCKSRFNIQYPRYILCSIGGCSKCSLLPNIPNILTNQDVVEVHDSPAIFC